MKTLWCWRCKMDVPMLDEAEWKLVSNKMEFGKKSIRDTRPRVLAEYERLTGFKETNLNAVLHHRISYYGPPCPRCGKVLRTPVAYKCFECGRQVHEPNWTHLFRLELDAFAVEGRGIVVITDGNAIANRLSVGDQLQFRDGNRIVATTTLLSIECMHGPPPGSNKVGLLLQSNVSHTEIKIGQDAWMT